MQTRDLGLFDQAMYNSLHGRFLEVSLRFPEGGSLFAEHLYLIMILILPIYALFPTPYTLFFLQALAGGAGAFVIFLLAKDHLRSELAATCFALAYLLHPSLESANLNLFRWGFHPDNFFSPLLLCALYSFQKDKRYLAASFWVLALAVDEKYAILLIALGLYLLIVKREIRFGAIMTFLSIFWFITATQIVVPHFLGAKRPWYLSTIGEISKSESGLGALALALVRYLLFVIGPLLLLPFADLPSLSVIVPTLLTYLVALASHCAAPMIPNSWHVNAVLPIVFLSAILGMQRLVRLAREPLGRDILITVGPLLVLIAVAFSAYWLGPLPLSRDLHPLRYAVDEEIAQSVKEVRSLIPHEASLAASRYIGSNFTQQRTILRLRTRSSRFATVDLAMWRRADYILIDINPHLRKNLLWRDRFGKELLHFLQRSEDYKLLYSKNKIWLFKKIAPTF